VSKRFQLDLLVGRRVYDAKGQKLGRVDELQLIQEGRQYVVEGLLIGVSGLADRLGLARFLEAIKSWLKYDPWRLEDHLIYWEQIDAIEQKCIRLKVRRDELQTFG
jgi:sporulation protein YlmC with PRC-barrel domain